MKSVSSGAIQTSGSFYHRKFKKKKKLSNKVSPNIAVSFKTIEIVLYNLQEERQMRAAGGISLGTLFCIELNEPQMLP